MAFTLEEYSKYYGELQDGYTIQEIEPKDGVRLFEVVKIPEPSADEIKAQEIAELKQYLADTDYVVIKIAEGVATAEEYAEVLQKRAEARTRINELESFEEFQA